MAEVIAQDGAWFVVAESPAFAATVCLRDGYVSPRMHPAVLVKDGFWEDVTDHEGAAEALRLYTENPPPGTIPVTDPFA